MINVSLECRRLMQTNTCFQEHVVITLADNTVLTIPQSDLIIQNNGITSGAGANAFPIGQASARTIRLEIANFDDKYSDYDFYGAKIQLTVKYPLSEGTENFPYGTYTVVTPETKGTTIKITAVDDMYKADRPYTTNLSFPTTALRVYLDACQTLGIGVQTARFTNDNFSVKTKPDNCSFRQVLGGCAMLAGGNAFINRDGRLEIKAYNRTPIDNWLAFDGGVFKPWENNSTLNGGSFNPWDAGDTADGDTFQNAVNGVHILYAWLGNPNVDTDDITITGLRADVDSENTVLEGTDGYVLSVENPLIVGKEASALALIGANVIGLKFRQFSGDYIGDPTIEFMDPCIVVDRKGNTYGSFVTDTDYSFRGKTSISNSAEPTIRTGISYTSNNTKTIQKARELINQGISSYDQAMQLLTDLMSQSLGFYSTKEVDASGAATYYTHDKPTLAQSTIIRKITANGISQSVDGGTTWTSGIDINGNAVLNTLAVLGINADWINAGQLAITDQSGNETFFADTQTGIVRIKANSFSLAGKTIQQLIDGSLVDPGNLLKEPVSMNINYWTRHGGIVTGQTDPYGSTHAIRLTPTSDEGYVQAKPDVNNPFSALGVKYRLSVWLKASNNNGLTNPLSVYLNGVAHTVNPTTSWKEYIFEEIVDAVTTTMPNDLVTIGGMGSFTQSDNYNLYIYRPRVTYALTQDEVFKDLSNNGVTRGIWLENGELYINMDFLQGGTAKFGGVNNGDGSVSIYDSSGNKIGQIDNEGIKFSAVSGSFGNTYVLINTDGILGYKSGKIFSSLGLASSVGSYTTLNARGASLGVQINYVNSSGQSDSIALFGRNAITFDKPYTGPSDIRLKENIIPTESDIIDELKPVSFDWKKDGTHVSAGFIAQEVQEILPELVFENDKGMLSLNYTGIIPHLVHKVQTQQKQINGLETRLARLEATINGNS